MPFQHKIEPETESALDALERIGVAVFRRQGCSAIDWARCEMASGCLVDGVEAFMFIDSDMWFHPDDAVAMLKRPEPVVGGLYSQKGFGKLNTHLPDDVTEIHVGGSGRDYYPYAIGAGFLRVRTAVLTTMIDRLSLPCCPYRGRDIWPFFQPMVITKPDGGYRYLGEDYAFCQRCIDIDVQPILDTRPRLYHIGRYFYGVDDAGRVEPERPDSFMIPHRPAT